MNNRLEDGGIWLGFIYHPNALAENSFDLISLILAAG